MNAIEILFEAGDIERAEEYISLLDRTTPGYALTDYYRLVSGIKQEDIERIIRQAKKLKNNPNSEEKLRLVADLYLDLFVQRDRDSINDIEAIIEDNYSDLLWPHFIYVQNKVYETEGNEEMIIANIERYIEKDLLGLYDIVMRDEYKRYNFDITKYQKKLEEIKEQNYSFEFPE